MPPGSRYGPREEVSDTEGKFSSSITEVKWKSSCWCKDMELDFAGQSNAIRYDVDVPRRSFFAPPVLLGPVCLPHIGLDGARLV